MQENENKKISIKDIARLSGVSIATVSRILNNKGRFSKETEQKVHAIVESFGYVSNMAAKSLRQAKSNTIGLIVPDISNDFFATIALYLETKFADVGYSVFICNSANDPTREKKYFKDLYSKQVDGIVCISGLRALSSDIVPKGIPIVCVDRYPEETNSMPVVSSDDFHGAYLATEHLIKCGCKEIMFISSYTAEYDKKHRSLGYEKALEDYNIPLDKNLILINNGKNPSDIEAEVEMMKFLESGRTCDGIFASNDRSATGALYAIKRFGLNVPKDIQLVGFDNSVYSRLPSPSITTISRNTTMLAAKAAETLLNLIDHKESKEKHLIVPVHLIKRESTKS